MMNALLLSPTAGPRRPGRAPRGHGAFTLIETLIVVVILGILAAIVVAQFRGVNEEANDSAIRMQLTRARKQIDYYRAEAAADPQLIANQWDDLVSSNYLQANPVNMLNGSDLVAAAPGPNVGWIWRDNGHGQGRFDLFATDESGLVEIVE